MRCLFLSWTRTLGLALSLLAIPAITSAQRARDDQREAPEVRKLRFEGVEHVDQNDLSKSISTRPSKCRSMIIQIFCWISHSPTFEDKYYLNSKELERDVIRVRVYYWKRGYRDTQVDTVVQQVGK